MGYPAMDFYPLVNGNSPDIKIRVMARFPIRMGNDPRSDISYGTKKNPVDRG
jgi:hypothetical protein